MVISLVIVIGIQDAIWTYQWGQLNAEANHKFKTNHGTVNYGKAYKLTYVSAFLR